MKTLLVLAGMAIIGFRFMPLRPLPAKSEWENVYNSAVSYSQGTTGFAIGLALIGAGVYFHLRSK